MTERRYDEEETAAIFARASEATPRDVSALPAKQGWSLAELQAIGREAGLAPEEVAAAARALDRPPQPAPRRFLGLTIGVGRTVQLDRRMDDAEWERLVVVLRDTFDARGQIRVEGSLRQWTNGNLQVLVEPTSRGDRVRFRTRNASAQAYITIGLTALATSGIIVAALVAQGALTPTLALSTASPFFSVGIVGVVGGWLRLRRWAPTRLQQMDVIAQRLEAGEAT